VTVDTTPKTRVRRRINGFGLTRRGRFLVESIRRDKLSTILAAKQALGVATWGELYRDGFRMARVQVLLFSEVNARHGNTGRKRKRTAGV
jgi:hypothetical protein